MALVLANRVQETTTTTGTGTITLAGAVSGFQSFAVIGNANTTYYTITSGTAWEVGVGTYTLSGTTLARTTILSSSIGGGAITLAGTSNVFATYPAEKSVNLDASGNATALGTPASGTVTNLTGTASININGTVGATTAAAGLFTTLGASAAVTLSPANANVVLSPTGTGVVTISPATAGTINRMSIGATTTSTGAFTTLAVSGIATFTASPQTDAANGFALFTGDPAGYNISRSGTTVNVKSAGDINLNAGGVQLTASLANGVQVAGVLGATTSLTTPLIIGGSAGASTLTLQSTSGAGTTDFIAFKTASQTERMRIVSGGNVGIGSTAPTAGRLTITANADPGTTAAGLAIAMTSTSGGTATPQYGINVTGNGYNNSTIWYGVSAVGGQGTNGTSYAIYGDISNNSNSVTARYGVYGRVANSSDSSSNLATGAVLAGVYGEVYDAFGTTNVSATVAGYFNNKATLGAASYGIYVNTVAGPTASFPVRVNHASIELFRITSTGQTLVVAAAGGLGYGTGSGGAVTQTTSRTTGVTLNKANGAITLVSAAGSVTYQSFTVTNSTVAATDTVIVSQKSGTDLNQIFVTAVAAGSFRVSFATTGGTTTEQPVFNFAVIKAVAA